MEFRLNTFAIRNLEYTYFALSKLYSLAVSNPLNVVLEQMRWMNKQPADLTILQSSYVEKKENELVELLLTVSNYTVDQLKEIKKKIVSCFRDVFPEIDMHNGSIENKKLEYLCDRYDLTLNSSVGSDNRKRYTINQRGEECNG